MIVRAARQLLTSGALLSLVMLCVGERAAQAGSRVVLLRASSADALSRQGTTLLTAELQALGFEAIEVDSHEIGDDSGDDSGDLRREIERVSARLQPVATFAILPMASGTSVELWLEDRVTGKLVIRRVAVTSGPGAAADLAVKAVELLRGSLLEVTVRRRDEESSGPPPSSEVRRFVAAAVDRRSYFGEGLGISAGVIALRNLQLASTYAPQLRISWGYPRGILLRLTASGLGSSTTVRAVEGEARADQALLLGEVARVFRPGARLQPTLGLAAGAHRVNSSGAGVSSLFPNEAGTTTAATLGVVGGLAARLADRVTLVLDLDLLATLPRTKILIASRQVATAGGAVLLLGASVCAVF